MHGEIVVVDMYQLNENGTVTYSISHTVTDERGIVWTRSTIVDDSELRGVDSESNAMIAQHIRAAQMEHGNYTSQEL